MAKFVKDALYVGKWHHPGGVWDCTPALRDHLANRMREMLAADLPIPLTWEHQPDAVPLSQAERAAHNAKTNPGHVEEARLTPDGILETVVDVPAEEDAKRLPSVRFASPYIQSDWVDGRGRLWPGPSILHLAATPRPVQYPQKPFRPLALSQSVGGPICLSLEGYTPNRGDSTVADDNGKKDGEGSGSAYSVKDVLKDLREFSPPIVLPDDTEEGNLFERLCIALKAIKGKDGKTKEPPVDDTPKPVDASSPIMMSMQARLTALEAESAALKTENTALKADNGSLKTASVEAGRKSLLGRLLALKASGLAHAAAAPLEAELRAVALSLDSAGALAPTMVQARIEAYEAILAAGGSLGPIDGTRLSHSDLTPTPAGLPPEARRQPSTPEETKAAVDNFAAMLPGGR